LPYPLYLFNAFFREDVTSVGGNTDIQGRLAAGGNVDFGSSIGDRVAGPKTNAQPCSDLTSCYKWSVVVGGTAAIRGAVWGGQAWASSFDSNSRASYQCQAFTTPPSPIDFAGAFNKLDGVSCHLNQLTETGLIGFSRSTVVITGSNNPDVEVFYTSTDVLAEGGSVSFTRINPGVKAIIINVAGDTFSSNPSGGDFSALKPFADKIIWNFVDATSIQLISMNWIGSIIAPNADITGNSGMLLGQVFANSYAAHIQINELTFSGCLTINWNDPCEA